MQATIDGGSNYDVECTTSYVDAYNKEGGDSGSVNQNAAFNHSSQTTFVPIARQVGNDNDQCLSGTLHMWNPSDTTYAKQLTYLGVNHYTSASTAQYSMGSWVSLIFNTTSAINGVQFKFAADEIQGGQIKLYGIT